MKLTIESMTYGTDGLAHADNGKAVFVQGAVAGDTVEAEVVQDGKSFMRARTTEILEPSPDRIQPPCPFVGICGGCSWGNLSRTAQLAAKTTRATQGVAVLTLKKKFTLDYACPAEATGIANLARYRARSLPAVGALLKAEDSDEKQISLMD